MKFALEDAAGVPQPRPGARRGGGAGDYLSRSPAPELSSTPLLPPIAPTMPYVAFDEAVRASRGDGEVDYEGWFCVATRPFPCPAEGCTFVAVYMTAAHLIVCFPARDDRMLLTYARDAREVGRDPVVEEYQPEFGPAIAFDEWVRIGRPIHGALERPSGWEAGWKPL